MLRHGAALWMTLAVVSTLQCTMAPGFLCRDSMRYIELPTNSLLTANSFTVRHIPFKVIGKVMLDAQGVPLLRRNGESATVIPHHLGGSHENQ